MKNIATTEVIEKNSYTDMKFLPVQVIKLKKANCKTMYMVTFI